MSGTVQQTGMRHSSRGEYPSFTVAILRRFTLDKYVLLTWTKYDHAHSSLIPRCAVWL